MDIKNVVGALFGSAVGLALSACTIEQPDPGCRVPHGFTNEMILKLTPVEGQTLEGACAEIKYTNVGIDEYHAPGSDEVTIAIRPMEFASLQDDEGGVGEANAIGPYMSEVPESGICVAESLEPATINVPEVPEEMLADGGVEPGRAAFSVSYDFDNVELYSTAEIPGTQLRADVTYSNAGCTGNYKAIGVYPPVACANLDGQPDDRLCDINTEPTQEERDEGIIPGCRIAPNYGIPECLNPAFVMRCDPETLHCFPAEFGQLRSSAE